MSRTNKRSGATPVAAAAPATSAVRPHRISRSRTLLFSGITTLATFVLLEVVLWLCRVQPAWVEEDPYAGFSRHIPHFVEVEDTDGPVRVTVSSSKRDVMNSQQFTATKPTDVYRIVCLGGSTTYGRPFYDETSFAGWLRELLPAADPSKRWEVINAGGISYASYRVLGVMEEMAQYDPDLFIVYTGQNEFLERRTYDGWSVSRSVAGPLSLIYRTRTATVVREVLDLAGLRGAGSNDQSAALGGDTKAIPVNAVGPDAYQRDDALAAEIVTHFRATLNSMSKLAERTDAKMLLVVPASNLADFEPFRSQHREGISSSELTQWDQHEQQARTAVSQGEFEWALGEIDAAMQLDDRYAALWYLKGQALQGLNRYEDAKAAFLRARDEDVCPLRAIEPLVEVARGMEASGNVSVVDFERVVDEHSEHGLPGKDLFHDHVHPTIRGNQLLALEIIDKIRNEGIVRPAESWGEAAINDVIQRVNDRLARPEYARQLRLLSAMMGWLNQPAAARTQAELSLEWSGRTEQALLELAAGFQANRAPALAFEYLREAVRIAPDSALSQLRFGVAALENGEPDLGITHLRIATQLDQQLVDAKVRLGVALAMQGQLTEAESQLSAAVQLTPEAAMVHNNLGLVIAKQGRFQEALKHYETSLSLDNRASSTHYNAGLACEELGLHDRAREHYQATIQLANGHTDAQNRLRSLLNR